MIDIRFVIVVAACFLIPYLGIKLFKLIRWTVVRLRTGQTIRKKNKRLRTQPSCFNCEFHTPYQMLNNRDERVNVNHCSVLSARIKSIHPTYIADMAVSVNDPETFSCNQHQPK